MSDEKSPSELSIDEILTTIRRIIAEDEQAGGSSTTPGGASGVVGAGVDLGGEKTDQTDKPDKKVTIDSDDILELTEALNEDGTTRHLAPIGGSARRTAVTAETRAPAPRPEPRSEPQPQRRETPNRRLAPEPPVAAAREEREPRDLAIGSGGRTLEDVVGDVLRPLLQSWLDENLQPLVERLVQAEIARVARESGAA
jgi:uncharacterized protein